VTIDYIKPSWSELGVWSGHGHADTMFKNRLHESDVGTIKINYMENTDDGLVYFEFKGIGEPKGSFFDDINKS